MEAKSNGTLEDRQGLRGRSFQINKEFCHFFQLESQSQSSQESKNIDDKNRVLTLVAPSCGILPWMSEAVGRITVTVESGNMGNRPQLQLQWWSEVDERG